MRPPTQLETYLAAGGIHDDVSFYVYRDAQTAGWEQNYEAWAIEVFGEVPHRLHTLGDPNQWGYPPGPTCVQGLPPMPPVLLQAQIDALNACVPFEVVVAATMSAKETLKAVVETLEAVAEKLPPG